MFPTRQYMVALFLIRFEGWHIGNSMLGWGVFRLCWK